MQLILESFGPILGLFIVIGAALLAIALLFLPLFVWGIYNRVRQTAERAEEIARAAGLAVKELREMKIKMNVAAQHAKGDHSGLF